MYRRVEVFLYVIVVGLIVTLYVLLFWSLLIFPVNYFVSSQNLLFLLLGLGSVSLFTGIKKIREAKAHGVHIRWWKQHLIILSLVCGFTATMVLVRLHIPDQVNNVLRYSILFLFFLLSLGLFMYLFILGYQQSIMNRPKQPPGE
jgi:hypothetical protein